jgi:RNA polymerase sigma factor (sigma-70 family)
MIDSAPRILIDNLRKLICREQAAGLGDNELLERFLRERDEAAFEVLVWRHGGIVWNACRRVLGSGQDAEDAFQATFLAFVREGAAISKRHNLGCWLYRVAYRIAVKAKAAARRRDRRMTAGDVALLSKPSPSEERLAYDVRKLLDEEVDALPEKYRQPFVLCYFAGMTNAAAADVLGCAKGTVVTRLAWARQRLRGRLARRGLMVSAVALAAVLEENAAASAPAFLIGTAVKAGMLLMAGGGLGTRSALLADAVVRGMHAGKLKTTAAALLVVMTVAGMAVLACSAPASQEPMPPTPAAQTPKVELPAPPLPRVGVIVLDDCDPVFQGKDKYEDNLTFVTAAGQVRARVSGLNICQEIGSPHRIAIDPRRRRVWVSETVGERLLAYDLTGNLVVSVPNVKGWGLAVDPATGNVWVARGPGIVGEGTTEVFDPSGRSLAVHDIPGYDMAYDAKHNAFWLVDKNLVKVSIEGKVLLRQQIADWYAVSVAVDARSGTVWAVTRRHQRQGMGKNGLLTFDSAGKKLHDIALGDGIPFRVAVDERDGSAWVTDLRKGLRHYDSTGKLTSDLTLHALAAEVEPATGNVWVVTNEAILKITAQGKVLHRTPHRSETSQAWLATYVPARELTHKDPALNLSARELAELWTELVNPEFAKADDAWRRLGAAGDSAVTFLRQQIRPIAVPDVDVKRVERLVAELDAAKFATREGATKELLALGELAIVPLQRLIDKPPSAEARQRAVLLLEKLSEARPTPDRLRVVEAIDLLEELRSAKALQLLQEIERDALVPSIRREARQALERLSPDNKRSRKD